MRDRGCRFPGCGSRFTDAHHVQHWADGGATRLDNLILLCRTHHRLLHEGGFRLRGIPERPDRPIFFSPRGIRDSGGAAEDDVERRGSYGAVASWAQRKGLGTRDDEQR